MSNVKIVQELSPVKEITVNCNTVKADYLHITKCPDFQTTKDITFEMFSGTRTLSVLIKADDLKILADALARMAG